MTGLPEIRDSSRRHQIEQDISDQDIWDAWLNVVEIVLGSNGMYLLIGVDGRGRLIEIGQRSDGDYPPPIVHAMLARPHLRRGRKP
ncbi:MAG: hypothetical protein ACT4QG_20215 [Sporichthyaceae bacterium]